MDIFPRLTAVLKKTCAITGADWAVYLAKNPSAEWDFRAFAGLNKKSVAKFQLDFSKPDIKNWLVGAVLLGRNRYSKTLPIKYQLDCNQIGFFPCQDQQGGILVGFDPQKSGQNEVWKLVASLICELFVENENALKNDPVEGSDAGPKKIKDAREFLLGKITPGIIHEINNPLTAITGFLELALDENEDHTAMREDLQTAYAESLRVSEKLRRLDHFSRNHEQVQRACQINTLVRECDQIINHYLQIQNTYLKLELAPNLPEAIVNENEIQLVILLIIQVLLEQQPKPETIWIRTSLNSPADETGTVNVDITTEKILDRTNQAMIPLHLSEYSRNNPGEALSKVVELSKISGNMIFIRSNNAEKLYFIMSIRAGVE
jgi:hypothetical protein